jgi:hypothetical protein
MTDLETAREGFQAILRRHRGHGLVGKVLPRLPFEDLLDLDIGKSWIVEQPESVRTRTVLWSCGTHLAADRFASSVITSGEVEAGDL